MSMRLRRLAKTMPLFEFCRKAALRTDHHGGNGYREAARIWWNVNKKT